MTFQDIHYINPSAIYWLLFLVPLWGLFWYLFDYRQKILEKFASPEVLQRIVYPRSSWRFWGKMGLLSLAWIFAVIAMMEPISYGQYRMATDERKEPPIAHDLFFVLDASASMTVPDVSGASNRLEQAKAIVEETLGRLHGEQVALYAFTADLQQMAPLTHDYLFVRLILRRIQKNEGGIAGTHLLDILEKLHKEYIEPSKATLKTIVVLTDGEDTLLEGESDAQRSAFTQERTAWMHKAEKEQLRIFTVGLGTTQGKEIPGITFEGKPVVSALNMSLLRQIAREARGKYYAAGAYATIDLAATLVSDIEQDYGVATLQSGLTQQTDLVYTTYFQIPLAFAILLLALTLWLSDTKKTSYLAGILLLWMPRVEGVQMEAQGQIALNRQAEAFLESGEFAQARALYQEMLQEPLNSWQRAVIMYNLGGSWLGGKEWDNAMLTFQAVAVDNTLGPVLEYRRSYNNALAFYGKAEEMGQRDPDQALASLRGFLPQLEKVHEVFCNLTLAEGASTCPSSTKVDALYSLFHKGIFQALEEKQKKILQVSDAHTTVSLLKERVKQLLKYYARLEGKEDITRMAKYAALFEEEKQQWMTLAHQVAAHMDAKKSEELISLLSGAQRQFVAAMEALQQAKWEQSKADLEDAEYFLIRLLEKLPPPKKSSPPPQEPPKMHPSSSSTAAPKITPTLEQLLQMEAQDALPLPKVESLKSSDPRPW
jgi:Ca-activated chloride channel family protein